MGQRPRPAPEEELLDVESRKTFWEWIDACLHDEKERLVVYGSFNLDLKPQEIFIKFQDMFSDVDEVYTIKQNVIARLRRDPDFRKFLARNA